MRYVARAPAIDELDIAALCPAQGLKGLPENHDPRLPFWVIRDTHQYANTAHAIRLLRARRKRPHCRRAGNDGDEVAPPHGAYPKAKDRRLPIAGHTVRRSKSRPLMSGQGQLRPSWPRPPSIYVCYASNSDRSVHHNEPTLRARSGPDNRRIMAGDYFGAVSGEPVRRCAVEPRSASAVASADN
jgi:hypothetical protein